MQESKSFVWSPKPPALETWSDKISYTTPHYYPKYEIWTIDKKIVNNPFKSFTCTLFPRRKAHRPGFCSSLLRPGTALCPLPGHRPRDCHDRDNQDYHDHYHQQDHPSHCNPPIATPVCSLRHWQWRQKLRQHYEPFLGRLLISWIWSILIIICA